MKNEIKMTFISPSVQYSSEDHFEHKIRMERYKDCKERKINKISYKCHNFHREIQKSTKNTTADLARSLFMFNIK